MRPSRRILPKALMLAVPAVLLVAGSALAQYYEPALRSLDLGSDVARSPRLLGMGSLSLAVPDRYQQFTLWDFAGSPLGIYFADTTSTIDLRPETGSVSGVHNLGNGVRQDIAGRTTYFGFEGIYRDTSGNAFGAIGELKSLRSDTPYNASLESRHGVSVPYFSPVANGVFPYLGGGKLRYSLRLRFSAEHVLDQYRTFVTNQAGEFLSMDGTTVTPPDLFKPDEVRVRQRGFGWGWSYPIGRSNVIAFNGDVLAQNLDGTNTGTRYTSEIVEKRPYTIGQATMVGRVGKALEYGLDGRTWASTSQQDWRFTISAGTGSVPLASRGKLLERKEDGASTTARARLTAGSLALAGQAWTHMTHTFITPPAGGDATSFNYFLYQVFARVNADSLALPDSVIANQQRDHAWGYGVGASWTLPRGVAGVEYHWARDAFSQTGGGSGPKRIGWDVRGGLESRCSKVVTGRVGVGYQWYDEDDFTRANEYKGWSGSLGMGLRPAGTSWNFDIGWSLAWLRSDYGDPTDRRSSRQQLASILHWTF